MNRGIIYGLIAGFLTCGFLSTLYTNNPINILLGYEKFSWLIIVALMITGVLMERNSQSEKFIDFNAALKNAFKIFIIAYLIKFIFIYLLFNYFDPKLLEMAKDTAVKIFVDHRDPDMTEEIFQQQLKAFRNGYFGPRLFDVGIMLEIIIGFVISLLSAIILRREKPEF
jgi:hypothetical protein